MVMPSVGVPESHWGVSRYLEFPWLREAKAETARLMRVFLDEDPREIRAHEGEVLDVMLYMGLVVTAWETRILLPPVRLTAPELSGLEEPLPDDVVDFVVRRA